MITVNEKFKSPVRVKNPCRLYLSANNLSVISAVSKGQILTPHDRDALTGRIYHIHPSDEAAHYLESRGGRAYTNGWVGSSAVESNYKMAKHILWLYENRHSMYGVPTGRFLVDGSRLSTNLIRDVLKTDYSFTPLVTEVIMKMLNSSANALKVRDGQITVSCPTILDFFRQFIQPVSREYLNLSKVKDVLVNMADSNVDGRFTIRVENLISIAQADGFDVTDLKEKAGLK
jgi:hypothetical protein